MEATVVPHVKTFWMQAYIIKANLMADLQTHLRDYLECMCICICILYVFVFVYLQANKVRLTWWGNWQTYNQYF